MNEVLNLYKNPGETPLECVLRFKKENPEYENVPMTYAGRLDPLAEGVLLVLAGDAVHRKEEFLNLKKEYEVEVIFGVGTDTYDLLGLVKSEIRSTKSETNSNIKIQKNKQELTNSAIAEFVNSKNINNLLRENAENVLKNFIGKNVFEYPSYSSKPVNGKPLFSLARSGGLNGLEIPKKEVEIYNLEILNWRDINSKNLLKDIEEKIGKVNPVKSCSAGLSATKFNRASGDFRQGEIISKWKEVLDGIDGNFQIVKIKAEVSSGTYMRTLAHEWGKALGVPAIAFHILRTKVGEYKV